MFSSLSEGQIQPSYWTIFTVLLLCNPVLVATWLGKWLSTPFGSYRLCLQKKETPTSGSLCYHITRLTPAVINCMLETYFVHRLPHSSLISISEALEVLFLKKYSNSFVPLDFCFRSRILCFLFEISFPCLISVVKVDWTGDQTIFSLFPEGFGVLIDCDLLQDASSVSSCYLFIKKNNGLPTFYSSIRSL